jgi:hypothetical protein
MASPKRAPTPKAIPAEVLSRNAVLAGLDSSDAALVVKHGQLVDLPVRWPIYAPNKAIMKVFFPINSILSVVTRMKDGNMIEAGTIGREGMSGLPLLLGASTTANECYCQVPGFAVIIDTQLFQSFRTNSKFQKLLDRYVQGYVYMLGQLAACNRLHTVYERCSRWLLMSQDRVGAQAIRLTHEYLAMMLGTQRSGVTIAAGTLQNAGLIEYTQGVITVLDRDGLEEASCECYEVSRDQFGGLLRAVGLGRAASSQKKNKAK